MKFINEGSDFSTLTSGLLGFIYSPAVPSRKENVFGSSQLYGLHTSLTSSSCLAPV